MKNIFLLSLLTLAFSGVVYASIPDGKTLVCIGNTNISFESMGEIFPTPYIVTVEGREFQGQLRASDINVIDLTTGGYISVDQEQDGTYFVTFQADSAQDIAQIFEYCIPN